MHKDEIKYRHFQSPLGEMIAGATSRGVCFLEWHDRGGVPRILERVAKRYRMALAEGTNQHIEQLENSQFKKKREEEEENK